MVTPNFLIAGTGNAGTSFLLSALMPHPDIYVPKYMRPEPHYFFYNDHYGKGLQWYSDKWFSEYKGQKAIGERSSSYLFGSNCAKRIAADFPNMKLVFILRNPIERAWSNYRFTVLNGLENLSFKDAVIQEKERSKLLTGVWKEVLPFSYKSRSLYGQQIEEYLKYFDAKQMLIISSESLRKEPMLYINKICDFIEVDSITEINLPSDFSSQDVISPSVQFECREYFGDRFNILVENLRKKEEGMSILSSDLDKDFYKKLRDNCTDTKQKISEEDKEMMVNILADDTKLFFSLVGDHIDFDNSVWNN